MGNAHEIVAPGHGQKAGQILNVVLVCLHVVGIAAVAPHGNSRELAHEVILQPRPGHLPGVVQILGSDEAHHRIDQKRRKPLGKAIAPRLHGHLVGVEMGVGTELRALPRLEVHHVRPLGGALLQKQLPGFLQCRGGEAEGLVALLATRDGLEDQVAGRTGFDSLDLRRHVGQHADLRRYLPVLLDLLKTPQHLAHLLRGVRHRVQADDRIPRAEAQSLQSGGRDALWVVGGVVGLQTARQRPRQADGGIAVGGDGDLACGIDEVEIAHQLAHRRDHLRRQPPAELADVAARGSFVQNPFPQVGHRPAPDTRIDGLVHVVLNDPGDLVAFIGDGGVFPEIGQRQSGKHHLGRHSLLGGLRRQACQLVAGFFLVGLGQHLLDIPECVGFSQQCGF